jgi:hypothetical protein
VKSISSRSKKQNNPTLSACNGRDIIVGHFPVPKLAVAFMMERGRVIGEVLGQPV